MPRSAKQKKEDMERIVKVMDLHARGVSFEKIAAVGIPGVGSKQQAHKLWKKGIETQPKIKAEEFRGLENMRLDNLEMKLNGIIFGSESDPKDVIRAAQTVIGLYKRRADLNGLDLRATDAPASGVQTVFVDMDVLSKNLRAPEETGDSDAE